MTDKPTRVIKVDYLARVEGEGAMYVRLDGEEVAEVKLRIFEPPRFFEAFLEGRDYTEVCDITARICGICPVAYQMSAAQAMEHALNWQVPEPIQELRRMLYCGEWISSHALHMYMLHAPDFLGYQGAVDMAKDHPEVVKRGLALKKVGNAIMAGLGGREVHPINVRVGGFFRAPTRSEMDELAKTVREGVEMARETLAWTGTLDYPELERDYVFVALRNGERYPFSQGRIVASTGLDIGVPEFLDHFREEHVEHSNALHGHMIGVGSYFVGPMARYNLNFDVLPEAIQTAALAVGLERTCKNPFKSLMIRAVETLYACEEALRIAEAYEPCEPYFDGEVVAAVGHGCTEAPRGLLYHRYEINADGSIKTAEIIPPTSQNQPTIEDDLTELVSQNLSMTDEDLKHRCEQAIRNYDPCISCATHFLDMKVERT